MSEAANKISQLRKEKGFNQKKFSELIGVSHPSLIKFEKGETDKIPIGVAKKMANLLKISVGELFLFDDYKEREKELNKTFDDIGNSVKKLEKVIAEKDKYILLLEKQSEKKLTDIFNAAVTVSELMNFYLIQNKTKLGLNEDSKSTLFEAIQAAHYVAMDDCFLKFLDTPENNFKSIHGDEVPYPGEGSEVDYFRDALKKISRFY